MEKSLSKTVLGPVEKLAEVANSITFGSFQVPLHVSMMPVSKQGQANESHLQLKVESSSVSENGTEEMMSRVDPLDKERYLCISDGFVICCLDLKQSKDLSETCSKIRPLPKISTLNLLEKGLPVSAGLFKLGSHVYMIGGQQFPCIKKDRDLWGLRLFHSLYQKHGIKGSSCNTYQLSLDSGSLSLSNCSSLGQMNKPKFWPIVEKIDDQIHVIESLPEGLDFYCPDTIPSHEVFNLKENPCYGWIKLSPLLSPGDEEFDVFIQNHFVVGQQIYAPHPSTNQFMVFDSKANKWELHPDRERCHHGSSYVKHVVDIFNYRLGWGVGGFVHGELSKPLYVVISTDDLYYNYPVKKTVLVAYLVTTSGKVMRYQYLPLVLEEFTRPFAVLHGKIINVDEEGKTFCVILHVKTTDVSREELLFISTFTMEEVADARSLVSGNQLPQKHDDDDDELPYSVGKEFVQVVVKHKYIFKTEAHLGAEGDIGKILRLQACFL